MKRSLRMWLVAAAVVGGCSSGDDGGDGSAPDLLPLPGDQFYPESIAIDGDGSLYVSSLATGQVVKFESGSDEGSVFIASGGELRGATGVLIDPAGTSLWACDIDLGFASNSRVVRFDRSTGASTGAYDLAQFGFCNDLVFDGAGNLFVADSFGAIHRLANGGAAFTVWSAAPELAPTAANAFGADGIVWDGGTNLYVNTFTDSRLFRIPILGNGSAGVLAEITVAPALSYPDGMRQLDANTLVVVEGAGNLTQVAITGTSATATTIATGLDAPTSVVADGDDWWVTEGQIPDLLSGSAPDLPFAVRRIQP